jgi:hypothetical protein
MRAFVFVGCDSLGAPYLTLPEGGPAASPGIFTVRFMILLVSLKAPYSPRGVLIKGHPLVIANLP